MQKNAKECKKNAKRMQKEYKKNAKRIQKECKMNAIKKSKRHGSCKDNIENKKIFSLS